MAPADHENTVGGSPPVSSSSQGHSLSGSNPSIATLALHTVLVTTLASGFYSLLMALGIIDLDGNLLLGMSDDVASTPEPEVSALEQDLRCLFTFVLGGLFAFYIQCGDAATSAVKRLNVVSAIF